MTFRPHYHENVLFWLLTIPGLFGIYMFGFKHFDLNGSGVAFSMIAIPLCIRLRYKIILTPETLTSVTLFRSRTIYWNDISSVTEKAKDGYFAGQFHGPFTYSFKGKGSEVLVNLKFFSRACAEEILSRLPKTAEQGAAANP